LEQLIELQTKISSLSQFIISQIDTKYEPVQEINQLNFLLDAHFEDVWAMLNTPAEALRMPASAVVPVIDSNQQQVIDDKPLDVKLDFYVNVLGAISTKMLSEYTIQKLPYIGEIECFFKIIVSKFLCRDPKCKELMHVAASIFDYNQVLHQHCYPNLARNQEYMIANYSLSMHNQRVLAEKQWRLEQLQPGDVVDAVKRVSVKDLSLASWSRATVHEVNRVPITDQDDPFNSMSVEVIFEKDREGLKTRFELGDWRFAPAGTYSHDFEWRYALKEGDNLDCMDDEKDWYKSTVMGTRTNKNIYGEEVREIYVAFRTYDDEGSKTDDQGNRFFGWSERYDAWYGVTDAQVQRFDTCHLQYKKVEAQNRSYDKSQEFDDREDLLYPSDKLVCFSAQRLKFFNRSHVICDALNMFGRQGGFDEILSMLEGAGQGTC